MQQNQTNWFFYVLFVPSFLICFFTYLANAHAEPVAVATLFEKSLPPLPQDRVQHVSNKQDITLPEMFASTTSPKSSAPSACIPFRQLRKNLVKSDHESALEALHMALNEVGDGSTYVWGRPKRHLRGLVTPTTSFRDSAGRVCRHIVYTLQLGRYSRRAEGIACRNEEKKWTVTG